MQKFAISGNKSKLFSEKLNSLNIRFTTEKGLFGFINFKVYSRNKKLVNLLFHISRKK